MFVMPAMLVRLNRAQLAMWVNSKYQQVLDLASTALQANMKTPQDLLGALIVLRASTQHPLVAIHATNVALGNIQPQAVIQLNLNV